MATITKTPAGNWKAQIRSGNTTIRSKTFRLKGNATAWARDFESDREKLDRTGDFIITLSDLVKRIDEDYLQAKKKADSRHEKLKKKFPDTSDYRARYWIEKLGSDLISDITSEDIEFFLDEYEDGDAMRGNGYDSEGKKSVISTGKPRAAATVNRMKSSISTMLNYALITRADKKDRKNKAKLLRVMPNLKAAHRPEDNGRVRCLSDNELSALLSACRASEWDKLHLLVTLAITVGARQSELLNLRWNDINFTQKTALLSTTKNGEPRVLTFPEPAMVELKKYQEIGNGLIFASEKKPDQPFRFRKHWDKALQVAGIEAKKTEDGDGFRFHDLRHTAASYLVMNGASLYTAGQILGHKSQQTTQRYAHLSTEHKAEVAERVMSKKWAELS